jgi:hypothetical protein
MRNPVVASIALIFACGLVAGCGGNGRDNDAIVQEPAVALKDIARLGTQGVKVPRELEELINHIGNAGFEIGATSFKYYEIIGATAGFGLEVGGREIELYYYDPAKTEPTVLNALKDLHQPGGMMAVVINGYYQMLVALHPEQERLIQTFMDF